MLKLNFILLFWLVCFSTAFASESEVVTDTQILVGTSAPLSGHAAYLGRNIVSGMQAYFNYLNDHGGIHGRKIINVAYDDDYNPPLMISNVRRLINESHVFALIGLVGTPTTLTVIKICQDSKIPLLFPFTGAHELRYPFKKYVVNLRPSYWNECAAAIDYFVKHGKRRFAVFYQQDAYGLNGREGVERRLIKHDLELVGEASYIRGVSEVEGQVLELKRSSPDAIALIGTADVCAAFIKEAVEHGMRDVWFFNVSFVGSYKLAQLLKDSGATVFITQILPLPTDDSLPAVREYRRLLETYFPGTKPNLVSFEGFLDAKLFAEALKRMGPNPTREGLIRAIESIKGLELGIGEKVYFSPKDHQGLDTVYITQIKNGQIIPVSD